MGKPTGQMEEDTQELLDHYNSHYWEYNDMCIDNQRARVPDDETTKTLIDAQSS